jgi:hypothetical protein
MSTLERRLLDSARDDAPSVSEDQAWARLEQALAAEVAEPGTETPGANGATGSAPPNASAGLRAAGWIRAGGPSQWGWGAAIAAAALGGALWQSRKVTPQPSMRAPVTARAASEPVAPRAAPTPESDSTSAPATPERTPAPSVEAKPTETSSPPLPAPRGAAAPRPDERGRLTPSPPPEPPSRSAASSTLAQQVERLDAATTALGEGRHADALAIVAGFHRDFPGAALAPDAEAVAIEALAARGDRAAVTRRGARFLDLHPKDPHAARVRTLVETGRRPP